MKYVFFVICIILTSCANRKTLIKRYADEAASVRQSMFVSALSNTTLSEKLSIPFRVLEYDTSGRITKEITGEIRRDKEEVGVDSVVFRDSTNTETKAATKEEIREKKSHNWQSTVIGSVVVLLPVFFFYFLRGR